MISSRSVYIDKLRAKIKMKLQIFCLLLKALVLCASAQLEDNRTELHVAFITSFEGEFDSSVAVPAVRLAADKVNEDETVLPGYKLVVELVEDTTVAETYANSKCNWIDSQRTFLQQITSGQDKVALIGCGCSLATENVAVSSTFWNITHISYTPTSELLSNRQVFPNVWRTYPSVMSLNSPLVAILRQYNWRKLKILTQDEDIFTQSSEGLFRELTNVNINITVDMSGTTVFLTQSNVSNLTESELFPEEIRVYFLNMYPTHARRIMCRAAYNHRTNPNAEHHYPGYVWITLGWYRDDWWRETVASDDQIQCSDEDIEPFIRNTFSIQLGNATVDRSTATDVGITAAEFENEISLMSEYQSSGFSTAAYHAYDAVWTLALAINSSLQSFGNEDIGDFTYAENGQQITRTISNQFNRTEFAFVGVSGKISFNENGTRDPAPAKVFKYLAPGSNRSTCGLTPASADTQRYLIARDNASTLVYTECGSDNSTWPDGTPSDGTPIIVLTTYFTPLVIVYDIAVVFGLAFAVFCLLFNFMFRKRKIVRLISPNLNYIIIVGAMLIYISVIFFVFPTTDPLLTTFACHFRIWTQTIGYFMCFGTIVAKMWRIYFIFYHPRVKITSASQMIVKDWHLSMIVVAMCLVVVIIGAAVAIVGDYKAVQVPDTEHPVSRNEYNILLDKHNLVCEGPRDLIWIIILYAYILITQLIAVILAFRTRKVEIDILNDAKYIALIIYITSIIVVIMIVCAILLSRFLNADGAVFGGLLYIFITTVLSIVFIPKMVSLYKDPKGENVFKSNLGSQDTGITLATTLPTNQNNGSMDSKPRSESFSLPYSVKVSDAGRVHAPPIEDETKVDDM